MMEVYNKKNSIYNLKYNFWIDLVVGLSVDG